MAMDKMLTIIIIFLSISFLFAAILITGVVPQIFQSGATLQEVKGGLIKLYNATTDFIETQENATHRILEQQNVELDAQNSVLEGQNKAIEKIEEMVNSTNKLVNDINETISIPY
jgi:hypothetical protein